MLKQIERFQREAKKLGRNGNSIEELKMWVEAADVDSYLFPYSVALPADWEIRMMHMSIPEDLWKKGEEAVFQYLKDVLAKYKGRFIYFTSENGTIRISMPSGDISDEDIRKSIRESLKVTPFSMERGEEV